MSVYAEIDARIVQVGLRLQNGGVIESELRAGLIVLAAGRVGVALRDEFAAQ